jgi:hypothetical protein
VGKDGGIGVQKHSKQRVVEAVPPLYQHMQAEGALLPGIERARYNEVIENDKNNLTLLV